METPHYNALQATLQRRFLNGVTILANYTWAKSIDVTSHKQADRTNGNRSF